MSRSFCHGICAFIVLSALSMPAWAQDTSLSLSGLNATRGLPVEMRADNLRVDNNTGETVFSGNAVMGQGDMRLAASVITIIYTPGNTQRIKRLEAQGSVTLVTADEAAEADRAIYEIETGTVTMHGDVILTQGENVLSGDTLFVNLETGQGQMRGNVRTIIQTTP